LKNDRNVIFLVIATGILSVVTQLLTIREFLSLFSGNEFVIALILFNWLIVGGIGTMLARFASGTSKESARKASATSLAWLSMLLSFLPVLQIFAIRILRDFFFVHGSSVGFYPVFGYTFCMIIPFGLLLGFVLPYTLFVLRSKKSGYSGTRIYMIDNIGDMSGGLIFSFLLVYLCSPMESLFVTGIILLGASFFVFPKQKRYSAPVIISTGFILIILLAGIVLEQESLAPLEGELAYYKETPYGRVEVHRNREQFTLFEDGKPLFSSQNLVTSEESVHYPMSQLDNPKNILLISAEGGIINELRKYRLERIDYLELNPLVTEIEFRFGLINKIPGLNVIHKDGRAFLKETESKYDAILINLPEPETFQVNRFFTESFFAMAASHLNPDGILSFSMAGFDNYLTEIQRQKVSSIYNTVTKYFNHVLLIPGREIYFLCRNVPLQADIPSALASKGIATAYVSRFYAGDITAERIKYLNELVDRTIRVNTDLNPYLMRLVYKDWFYKFSSSPKGFIAALLILSAIYLFFISAPEFTLFTTGCMTMGSEILVIFVFQIFYGYIYLQIGLIVTIFLAGLLPGAWLGHRYKLSGRRMLILTDAGLILLSGIFILILWWAGDGIHMTFFFAFGFFVSVICGFQFPLALSLKGSTSPAVVKVFSADLIGAAFGSLITSALLIPYCGILWTATGLAGLKLLSMAVLIKRKH